MKIQGEEMVVVYVNLNQIFFFLFETHYTGSVASRSKCVPSYSPLMSFKKNVHLPNTCQITSTLSSDIMNTQ